MLVFVLFLQKLLLAASGQHLYFVELTDDFAGRLLRQDQKDALANFSVGVGILSKKLVDSDQVTLEAKEDEARYGTWVVVQEKMELDEDGKYELIQTEIPTRSCSKRDFYQAAPDAGDFIDSHIEDLTCFDNSLLSTLQPYSQKYRAVRPKLRLEFIPCDSEERDCENSSVLKDWLESSTLVLYYDIQSLDAEDGSNHSRAMLDFSSITQYSLYNFDISLKSLSHDIGFLASHKVTDSFISLSKLGI